MVIILGCYFSNIASFNMFVEMFIRNRFRNYQHVEKNLSPCHTDSTRPIWRFQTVSQNLHENPVTKQKVHRLFKHNLYIKLYPLSLTPGWPSNPLQPKLHSRSSVSITWLTSLSKSQPLSYCCHFFLSTAKAT